MCIRDSVSGTSQKAIANLGWEEIKIPAPVFVGDTLYSETEVLDKRESKSRQSRCYGYGKIFSGCKTWA